MRLYGSVNPAMPFVKYSGVLTRNQYNRQAAGPCLTNPTTQKLLSSCAKESIDYFSAEGLSIEGLALDTVDVHGQTTNAGRIGFTCFCKYCSDALSKVGRVDYRTFMTHPNPVNLVLKGTKSGISHFEIDLRRTDPKMLIELSKEHGIFDADLATTGENAEIMAKTILDYATARSRVTASAIESIGRTIRQSGVRFAVITNSPNFDWTDGCDLWHLSSAVVDQVWTDTGDLSKQEVPVNVSVYHYLAGRARYGIDNYFEYIANMDIVSKLFDEADEGTRTNADQELHRRASLVLAHNHLGRSNVSALEAQGAFDGFVAAPITEDAIRRIRSVLTSSVAGTWTLSASSLLMLLIGMANHGQQLDLQTLVEVGRQTGIMESE